MKGNGTASLYRLITVPEGSRLLRLPDFKIIGI
jgi:hypothetical protein